MHHPPWDLLGTKQSLAFDMYVESRNQVVYGIYGLPYKLGARHEDLRKKNTDLRGRKITAQPSVKGAQVIVEYIHDSQKFSTMHRMKNDVPITSAAYSKNNNQGRTANSKCN